MLKKIYTQDLKLQQIQDNVDDALRPIQTSPLSQGVVLLSSISLTSGKDNLIAHGLKKYPNFWILAGNNSNAVVWNPTCTELSSQSSNSSYINFRCSANCIINVLLG